MDFCCSLAHARHRDVVSSLGATLTMSDLSDDNGETEDVEAGKIIELLWRNMNIKL